MTLTGVKSGFAFLTRLGLLDKKGRDRHYIEGRSGPGSFYVFALETLAEIVARRAEADADSSYTRALLDKGVARCAKKFGEEATEAVIAAVAEDDAALTAEAADVLYHLLVVLRSRKVPLSAVMQELERRTAQSGHAEKAARLK